MKSNGQYTGSFRDPAGFIFEHHFEIYRQVNNFGQKDYDFFISSGLYDELSKKRLLIEHKEVLDHKKFPTFDGRYKVIKPKRIPFISYPYEWTFSQLKAAALLTLEVQKTALKKGMILKDASAYNIQFIGSRPVFIDSLSFRIYKPGVPWDGYKQFCQHFIAPLAIASYTSPEIIKSLRVYLDGIPIQLAARMLPSRAKTRWGLLAHIHLHSASQKRYDRENLKPDVARRKVSHNAMLGLLGSLERTTQSLQLKKLNTEWGAYYDNTNYSKSAFLSKKKIVSDMLASLSPAPKTVWDVGANDGTFSQLAAKNGAYTIAFDLDYQALEHNFKKERQALSGLILPLNQDLSNPSPALGWAHRERASLEQRGPADAVMALALIHHLAIGNNSPLKDIAVFFKSVTRHLIIEFVPKSDSKVKLLLRGRNNMFSDYTENNFKTAFAEHFKLKKRVPVPGSHRVIYLYKAKA